MKFLIVAVFCISISFSQNEANNWYFGQKAGVSFNNGFPVQEPNGELITVEGCATISNKNGDLLFYTNGVDVWDRNHAIMPNGTGLLGNVSSTQSAIIVPKPNSLNIYYIFTVAARAGTNGLRYSEVDMNLNGGLGNITTVKNVLLESSITEKITAIENSDGISIWVLSHKWNSNEFVSFKVDEFTGVNPIPIVSAVGSLYSGDLDNTVGYLKASPDRKKIAIAKSYSNKEVQILDFNSDTGVLSNPKTINNFTSPNVGPYGCEFSPNSELLYVSEIFSTINKSKIHQYQVNLNTSTEIINSDIIVGEKNATLGALQQAVNGKIYIAEFSSRYLGSINNPNNQGLNCNYESGSVFLGDNLCLLGLPPFIQSYFFATNIFENTCYGDQTEFSISNYSTFDNISWDFGDPTSGAQNTSTLSNPNHTFTSTGTFEITITFQLNGETQTIFREVTISDQPPQINIDPIYECTSDDSIIPEFNLFSNIPTSIINDSNLSLSFYENIDDLVNSENIILNPQSYLPSNLNQTIFLKINNSSFGDCFSVNPLELNIFVLDEKTNLNVSFCATTENEIFTLNVGELSNPIQNYNFNWLLNGSTGTEIEINNSGVYEVLITYLINSTESCEFKRSISVDISSLPFNIETSILENSVLINATGFGDYIYGIDSNNLNSYSSNGNFKDLEIGFHTLFVFDKNGCGLTSLEIFISGFPLFFTPNSDGYNDYWQYESNSVTTIEIFDIFIYDRYGKLLKNLKSNDLGWDGKFNGLDLPSDDYWFVAKFKDGRVYKNNFTLKR